MSGLIVAGFYLTRHAVERMVEMGLTCDQLAAVLRDYENRYEQGKYGAGRVMYQLGALAVATAERPGERRVVVSVLWNEKAHWTRPASAAT